MRRRRVGEIILVGVAAVVFFATVSKGASFGQKVQTSLKEKNEIIRLKGFLNESVNGKFPLFIEVFTDSELKESVYAQEFLEVNIENGFFILPLNTKEAGLSQGQAYWLKVKGEGISETVARLEIAPKETFRVAESQREGQEEAKVTAQYEIVWNDPRVDGFTVKATNTAASGRGIWAQSNGGVGLFAESKGTGVALEARHQEGGTAILAEGKVDVEGDLTVIGETSLNSVSLPDNSVGSAEIEDESIVNADIANNTITANKFVDGRDSGLDADLLDGKDSSSFVENTGNLDLSGDSPQLSIDNPVGGIATILMKGAGVRKWQIDSRNNNEGDGDDFWISSGGDIPEFMVDQGSGNIGIGTTTPTDRLEIAQGYLRVASGIRFATNPESYIQEDFGVVHKLSSNGPDMAFRVRNSGSAEILTVRADGVVGIGTAVPEDKLEVAGGYLRVSNYGIRFATNPESYIQEDFGIVHKLSSSSSDMAFRVKNSGGAEILTVRADGVVGIGTTVPKDKLEVADGYLRVSNHGIRFSTNPETYIQEGYGIVHKLSSSTSDMAFRVKNSNNAEVLTVRADGTVGIGKTDPIWKLEVMTGKENGRIGFGMPGGRHGITFYDNAGLQQTANIGVDETGGRLRLWTGGDIQQLILTNAGNVGIGTETPVAKLQIAGYSASSPILAVGDEQYGLSSQDSKLYFHNKAGGGYVFADGGISASGPITGTNVTAHYKDLAEWAPSKQTLVPGTVVVIDVQNNDHVLASTQAYDSKVAGVVSYQPGLLLGEGGEGQYMIAHTGRVKVKVDANYGAIEIGDLLVTSPVEGTAMKSQPIEIQGRKFHEPGTILGKALEALKEGQGEILVLLSLQ